MPEPKRIAALVTEYRRNSHADVIVGKIIEGFNHDGRDRPNMQIVSMFVDQFPPNDTSRTLLRRHHFTITDSIEDALTLRQNRIAVDGVLVIGEHGRYDLNDRGQILYPRRRFFEAATNAMIRYERSVPIFSDKHLEVTWDDANWMVERARRIRAPFMAGSSIPVTWRRPALELPRNCELTDVVQIGYGPFEAYGFHALEGLQCMVERRRGGETGVRAVQCLQGEAMWAAMDRGVFSREVLEAGLRHVSAHAAGDYRTATLRANDAAIVIIEYRDGLRAAVAMLNPWIHEGDGGAFIFAGKLRGREQPVSTLFWLQNFDPFAHFASLVRGIDHMMQTGRPPYPVERTLLTTGILEAVMISKNENNRRVETPHLDVSYQPTDWPFAPEPPPPRITR